jgi:hypothetical protein
MNINWEFIYCLQGVFRSDFVPVVVDETLESFKVSSSPLSAESLKKGIIRGQEITSRLYAPSLSLELQEAV